MKLRMGRCHKIGLFAFFVMILFTPVKGYPASQVDISGPAGSGTFGKFVTVLNNGNFVVADPEFGSGGNNGAVYLYNGQTRALISSIAGNPGDLLGSGGVFALPNGNYVVSSPDYTVGGLLNAGLVSFCNSVAGCSSPTGAGSMAGTLTGQRLSGFSGSGSAQTAFSGVKILTNGNFVVTSPNWYSSGNLKTFGAVTLCSGSAGCPPAVSSANSLIGNVDDYAGGIGSISINLTNGVLPLSDGKYAVESTNWSVSATDVGALTLCGASGCTGVISSSNSLIGSANLDAVGNSRGRVAVAELGNGSFAVGSPGWTNPSGTSGTALLAGAVTFCATAASCVGTVSAANSLVGTKLQDRVGDFYSDAPGFALLSNGNYVVTAPLWDNGSAQDVGASVWCNKTTGCVGAVNSNNPLIGDIAFSRVGQSGAVGLANGNYVVATSGFNSGRGAATFCAGTTGCHGSIGANVSLTGTSVNDHVGLSGITALTNGNYIVNSQEFIFNGVNTSGASTFCNGTTGCSGAVTSANSFFGVLDPDSVGSGGATALTNGGYVVNSPAWNNGKFAQVGATTFCGNINGCAGAVTTANSLYGGPSNDNVGSKVTALSTGSYAVISSLWDNGAAANAGAVTFCSGTSGCSGIVSTSNSIYGTTANDQVGKGSKTLLLPNGGIVFDSTLFDNGAITDAGAVTYMAGNGVTAGAVSTNNSVIGTTTNNTPNISPFDFSYDPVNQQLVVGRGLDNKVTIFEPGIHRAEFDFDGDGRADHSVFRPSSGVWYLDRSTAGFAAAQFGLATDKQAPADYDGDGKADIAVWRESAGDFYILNSSTNSIRAEHFGMANDQLTVGDWDGDGKADLSVYRNAAVGNQSYFYYRGSMNNPNGNVTYLAWGIGGDKPLRGDFDGDGKFDLAVYRATDQIWYIVNSSNSSVQYIRFGLSADKLIPSDYDGDGKTDVAVYRPNEGIWYILQSSNGQIRYERFGLSTDMPVPADYDGDGKADTAVYRDGLWIVLQTAASQISYTQFGLAGDKPGQADLLN